MFSGLNLQEICNVIILVSAVIIALKNIYGFFKKPVADLQDKARLAEEKRIVDIVEKKMPEILNKHSQNVKGERQLEDKKMADSIKGAVIEAMDDKIEEVKEIQLDQGTQMQKIQKAVDLLNTSQLDLMRYNMNRLYYKYRPFKKILDCDKKAFIKLYKDYHEMGGNTWIDTLHDEVITWETVEDDTELKLDN